MPIPARILVILAHPDDETFVAAGLARRHVERGAKVVLVTATRGDAGRVGDPPLCVRDALPALRELLAPVAVDRSPSPPRSWAKTAGSPLLVPEIDRQQAAGTRVAFRADAAFAKPEIYDALETRDVDYVIRMPANKSVELEIEDLLFRPPGRLSRKPLVRYKSFRYQAESWTTPRRIVAKVEHHQGELFPRIGFIVTNMVLPSRSVVRFYNKRGTAEQWIKEGKQATHWTRLSCHRFRANEVRLQLSVLAYNLGNLWRRLVLPPRIKRWSLTSLQQRLVKTGGRLVKHARYYWLLLAPAGRRASDPSAVRRHAAEDLGAASAGRIAGDRLPRNSGEETAYVWTSV